MEELELYKDCGSYFLKAKYTVENDIEKKEIRFPRIRFDVGLHHLSINHRDAHTYIDMGLANAKLILDTGLDEKTGNCCVLIRETLEEKTKEMTIAEIEKKLGHKIKIVAEDKKNGTR